jgi:excisionase family DNA binding protein
MTEHNTQSDTIRSSEAAEILGVTKQTVVRMYDDKILPGWTVLGQRRFRRSDVEAYRQKHSNQSPPQSGHDSPD